MDANEQYRYNNDPLYHQKVLKRQINKDIKFFRKRIEDLALEIGFNSQELEKLISQSVELDAEIKQLQEKN